MRDATRATPSWVEVLDALDADARGDASALERWSPPVGLGPIPPELIGRARAVLAVQGHRAGELERQRTAVAAELAAVRAVPTDDRASVYLDVTG